ncbi:MAG: UbiA family prenyltransferase [Candidatus Dormibacterales bacterium]
MHPQSLTGQRSRRITAINPAAPPAPYALARRALWLLACCHPEPALAVTTLSTLLAVSTGRGWGSLWVASAIGTGQLHVGWTNDFLDRHRDAAAGRRDKPVARGAVDQRAVGWAAALALPAAMLLSTESGTRAAAAHGVSLLAAGVYNLGLKGTALSPLAYAAGFGALPSFLTLGAQDGESAPPWATVAGALLGSGAHFLQVLPDIERDRAQGTMGLPQRLGLRTSALAGSVMMSASALTVVRAARPRRRAAAAALATTLGLAGTVALSAFVGRPTAAFRLGLITAASTVATLALSGARLMPGRRLEGG